MSDVPVSTSPDSDRLNGWKEIASFLGKGVRTVQRWEREYGLPIHRLGREGGEIVFAFRSEVDRWTTQSRVRADRSVEREQADPVVPPPTVDPEPRQESLAATDIPASPVARRRPGIAAAGAVATAIVIIAAGWFALGFTPAQPLTWRVQANQLQVFGAGGRPLWTYAMGFTPTPEQYDVAAQPVGGAPVLLEDLDGDDINEVLFTPRNANRRDDPRGLVVFDTDGSVRFEHRLNERVTFGDRAYAAPWLLHRMFVTINPDGGKSVWVVYIHGLLFPTLVVELSPQGIVRSQFWNNGYIETVTVTTLEGRPVVLMGGTNNETKGASLAVFDYGEVAGSAPATNPEYRCTDCGPDSPRAYLVFPRRCAGIAVGGQATIWQTWVDKNDVLNVGVFDGPGAHAGRGAVVWYAFAPGFRLIGAEMPPSVETIHGELERAGQIKHPFGDEDLADLFPVHRWTDGSLSDLPPAPVTR